jgi:hypothetical protein
VVALVARIRDSGKLAEKGGVGLDPVCISLIVDGLADDRHHRRRRPAGRHLPGLQALAAVWGAARKLKDGTCGRPPGALWLQRLPADEPRPAGGAKSSVYETRGVRVI